jgi:hypothetical protein
LSLCVNNEMMSEEMAKSRMLVKGLVKKGIPACPLMRDVTMSIILRESTVGELKDLSNQNNDTTYDGIIMDLIRSHKENLRLAKRPIREA